jgi:DNA repair protein RecO (recombination protein O)
MRIILEPSYVLHTRPYRDTSLLVDLLTLNHGKVSVIARSARGLRSRFKGSLVLFSPLLITASGKSELLQLSEVEISEAAVFLEGDKLFFGLYLNELLVRLLQKYDPCPGIFNAYAATLKQFVIAENCQLCLRRFEMLLLSELGYQLPLHQAACGSEINSHQTYAYQFNQGFVLSHQHKGVDVFQGEHLLEIANQNFESNEILASCRRLMRLAIGHLLGDYTLKTRELFL